MKDQPGLFVQLRAMHWAVKIVMVATAGIVGAPLWFIGLFLIGNVLNGFGVFLSVMGSLALAIWFIGSSPAKPPVVGSGRNAPSGTSSQAVVPRYCELCGTQFSSTQHRCPACGTEWTWLASENPVRDITRHLNLLVRDHQDGLLDQASFLRLKQTYEDFVAEFSPNSTTSWAPPEPSQTGPSTAPAAASSHGFAWDSGPSPGLTESAPEQLPDADAVPMVGPEGRPVLAPQVTTPSGPNFAELSRAALGWAAERQADILLYVGAFMLSIAALIFVAYQGESVSGGVRFGILTTYAVAFLALGLLLHRWERVKEAGPIFLGLGAILVPIDFVALRTQVLGEGQVADDVLWLIGSSSCAALYLSLALRGYGRIYFAPPGPALLVAWGSLGSVIGLPDPWFGPWYLAIFAPGYVSASAWRGRFEWAKWASLAFALLAVPAVASSHLLAWNDGSNLLAVPIAYAMVTAAAAAGLRWRREELALALLPPLGAMTVSTACWATVGLPHAWWAPFIAATGAGYLVIAHFEPARSRSWAALAASVGILALVSAHAVAPFADQREALPVTYAILLVAASGTFGSWRWVEAGAAIPVLAAMLALSSWWAVDGAAREWYGTFVAVAPLGYLALALFDKPDRTNAWRWAAVATAIVGPALAHPAVALDDGTNRWGLAAAYLPMVFGFGLAFWRWRFEWRVAPGLIPATTAMTALSVAWAAFDVRPEWYGAFAATSVVGYLLLERFDSGRNPPWRVASLAAAGVGLALAHGVTVATEMPERWASVTTDGVVLACAVAAFLVWRFHWRTAAGTLPAMVGLTAMTVSWAQWDLASWWFGSYMAAAAVGYVGLALTDDQGRARAWLGLAAVALLSGTVEAQFLQLEPDANRYALPLVYGIAAAVLSVTVGYWRSSVREAITLLPTVVAILGATLLWARYDMPLDWLTSWAAVAAVGYLVPAFLDRSQRGPWRVGSVVVGGAAILLAHLLALEEDPVRLQLVATYGVLFVGWSWQAAQTRDESLLAPPILGAMFGATAVWAADSPDQWWPSTALGIASVMLVTSFWWERRPNLAKFGWAYSVAMATIPTVAFLPVDYYHPVHGLICQLISASLMMLVAVRSRGGIAGLMMPSPSPVAIRGERLVLIQAGFAFIFGAAASFNGIIDAVGANRTWSLTAIALIAWVLMALPIRRQDALWTFAPVGLAGMTVAAIVASDDPATLALVFVAATAGPILAYLGVRRWMLFGVANSFFFLTVWSVWRWQEVDLGYLPIAFAAIATLEWAAFTTVRRYVLDEETSVIVAYLSWGPWLAAAAVAGIVLGQKQSELDASSSIVTTTEWALAAAVLAMGSAAVAAEGLRLWRRLVWSAASIGLLGAVLMGVASFEPENVQAYTIPVGAFLVLIGLTFGRSPEVFSRHLLFHELLMILGALVLVLPPAEQSFDPGGGKFGLELIGIGLSMLLIGLVMHARWLVSAGVSTLTLTSLRMVTGGLFSTPYWLLLGLAGTALLGIGFLVLLERERWDRLRRRVMAWWSAAEAAAPPADSGDAAPSG